MLRKKAFLAHYAIYGASGFGREVLPLLREQLQERDPKSYALHFVDDQPPASEISGVSVVTYAQWRQLPAKSRHISLAVSNSQARARLAGLCSADGVEFISISSPTVVARDGVRLGAGAIVCDRVTFTCNIRVGTFFHANIHSYVGHDCIIGDFVTFAPAVHCNGNIQIEDHAYIGAGAMLRQGKPGAPLVIGRGAVVGMGAVVLKSVPAGETVVGNPARPLIRRGPATEAFTT